MIRVGPAGWSYPDWEGRVYPAHKPVGFHALAHLARTFDCVEINSTFYAMPRPEHAERWARLVADRTAFRFLVKLNREFTHGPVHAQNAGPGGDTSRRDEPPVPDLGRLSAMAAEFHAGIEPLQRARRLACVLAQFPASFLFGKSEVRRLGHLKSLFPDLRLVLEVRHASWFAPPALDAIRGLSYSLAYLDMPPAWNHPPDWHASTGPIGYLRLHGRNSQQWFRKDSERDDKYDYLYSPPEIEELERKAERIAAQHEETYVIANNHFRGQAVANAIELLALLRREPVLAPPEIVEAFPHLRSVTRIDGQQPLF